MKIVTTHYTGNDYGEGESLLIEIDGKEVFDISGGEPEDNTLGRDLNFAFSIPDVLTQAFELGKKGGETVTLHKEIEGSRWNNE